MSELSDALDRIVEYWNRVHPGQIERILEPGADAHEIAEIEQEFGITFPRQLKEFYQWSRGPATGLRLNVVAGTAHFYWPNLSQAGALYGQFAKWEWWQPEDQTVWPFLEFEGKCVSVQISPNEDFGSVWQNNMSDGFYRICDSMAHYFRTVLDDYPPEDQFPDWETLEEWGFCFKGQGKYNYGDVEWLNQVGYGPNQ